ncbi:MAG: STAS domain-containing protein [Candidatus Borkfalkiaceae bacterium]|nr:STAS domain-containing protein [Christensenellaceae bacterium]
MEIKYKVAKSGLYIYFDGELDEHYCNKTREKLDELIDSNTNVRSVVFNMHGLSFMDSTGIGMLIGRYKKLKNLKIPVFIENPSFPADKVFSASGIYTLIPKL